MCAWPPLVPSWFSAAMRRASSASSSRRSGSAASTACSALVSSPVTCARHGTQSRRAKSPLYTVTGRSSSSDAHHAGCLQVNSWCQRCNLLGMPAAAQCHCMTRCALRSEIEQHSQMCRFRVREAQTHLLLNVQYLAVVRDALDLVCRQCTQQGRLARTCARPPDAW